MISGQIIFNAAEQYLNKLLLFLRYDVDTFDFGIIFFTLLSI